VTIEAMAFGLPVFPHLLVLSPPLAQIVYQARTLEYINSSLIMSFAVTLLDFQVN
jgi:hypothetical protein